MSSSAERDLDARLQIDDLLVEGALRPTTLAEFVGQDRVRDQLGLVLEAARRRSGPSDHRHRDERSAAHDVGTCPAACR
jgi:Holliday junction DNA helicase RuvB